MVRAGLHPAGAAASLMVRRLPVAVTMLLSALALAAMPNLPPLRYAVQRRGGDGASRLDLASLFVTVRT